MTFFETINAIETEGTIEQATAREDYLKLESELIDLLSTYLKNAEVHSRLNGTGVVSEVYGDILSEAIVKISFPECTKDFSLPFLFNGNRNIWFADISEIGDAWDAAFALHTDLTTVYKDLEHQTALMIKEAERKAEADKKAEASCEKQKEKNIKDFEALTQQAKTSLSSEDEFYYALSWLAKYAGNVSATLPNYLEDAFKKYFGDEASYKIIDPKKKTVNGYSMKWSWSFNISLKKHDSIPSILVSHMNSSEKAITDTSFIWDLVDNYGFKFSKKQDTEAIAECIPTQFMSSFEEGLTA